ncbi:E3 ubiquitin-protein ligase RNF135-like [Rana temporaria]|uniref:E3 ubiquitin-protein ligase RNF135-like n=1 Tax=Rana temporaria TaxID=8407 RepID=UPI001AAD67D0|nr:E3 ubiquitin-protein ligase RNF135-like [Rana temporaria]
MASADLTNDLKCSTCLDLYTEPISLKCGHNFCQDCLVTLLDTQGEYSCPECKEQYTERPLLEINGKLCDTMDDSRPAHVDVVFCTYCSPPVPASKSCLHCEASYCEKHLSNHSKATHHLLIEPTASFEDRKCPTHQEILKYYCSEDNACICMSCWVAGDHRGHRVEILGEASEKKFNDVMEKLNSETKGTDVKIQKLENYRTAVKEKAADFTKSIGELFIDIRRQLDDVEKKVLTEMSRQEDQMSKSASDLIRQLEIQKDNLAKKINENSDLHKSKDPLTLLKKELLSDKVLHDDLVTDLHINGYFDDVLILQTLHRGLLDFAGSMMELKKKRHCLEMKKSDVLLDEKTASNDICISKDLHSASYSDEPESRPDSEERFISQQVLSTRSFSSGTHYWEVDVSAAKEWLIGVANQSIERKAEGVESYIGYNAKSWGLTQRTSLQARHKNALIKLDSDSPIKTVGIHLDYSRRRLSFYQLDNPIRHLHTFATTFKEPLHAAFYVFADTSIRIIN